MKTAVVHDWLVSLGGAERVLAEILQLFPSPLFTLFKGSKELGIEALKNNEVTSSFIQKLPLAEKYYRNYLPLFPLAIGRFDLENYELIISSSHTVAKAIKKTPEQLHICYCHTPMRYAWDLEDLYTSSMGVMKRALARQILKYLRQWDVKTEGVDYFVANSLFVAERIQRLYHRPSTVIYPPVATHLFSLASKKKDYYLTVSRLVPYKKIDLIIEAFRRMPHRQLIIVGDGPDREKLEREASENVQFLGFQTDEAVRDLMAEAKGFVFAAVEDFGISVVEAQAAGTAVIAYGKGGALETIVPGRTGLFFQEQTAVSLMLAIEEFEKYSWEKGAIKTHSHRFGTDRFKAEFKQFINQHWRQFCENRDSCRR